MDITNIIQLLGGIGMFLYGMNLLGSSLERLAGARLEKTLAKLTDSKLKGVLLGLVVTCVIQSSAATSVMAIGFVNAGIMHLIQAIPVIMGANIGTTITAQILRLGDIHETSLLMLLLKPASFAPVCIAVGAGIMLVSKKVKTRNIAMIITGFGILFVGMVSMEQAMRPLADSAAFNEWITMFSNPLLGVLIGMAVTAVLQSSSASVGVLQAMSSTGSIRFATAIPILIGMNIGKCITVVIASIGTNKKAKRAVCIDVMNNVIGAVLFLAVIYGIQITVGFPFWNSFVNRGSIANFHSTFNIVTTIVVFPFCGRLIELSRYMVKDAEESKLDKELALLDELFLKTPALALQQCKAVMESMGETALENLEIACQLLDRYDEKSRTLLEENEKFMDKTETILGDYTIQLMSKNLDEEEHLHAGEIIHSISDFERISDYCVNIASVGEYNAAQSISFSQLGNNELQYIIQAVHQIVELTVKAYIAEDLSLAAQVEPLEECIDELVEILKGRHIERLQNGQCDMEKGISYVEVLTNIERIGDHCSNIAVHLLQRFSDTGSFDPHEHLAQVHRASTEEYRSQYQQYFGQYVAPLKNGAAASR